MIVGGEDEYRALLDDILGKLTEQVSFVASWIDNHLSEFFSKLS